MPLLLKYQFLEFHVLLMINFKELKLHEFSIKYLHIWYRWICNWRRIAKNTTLFILERPFMPSEGKNYENWVFKKSQKWPWKTQLDLNHTKVPTFLKGNVKSYQKVKTALKNIDPRRNGSQIIANFKKSKKFPTHFSQILKAQADRRRWLLS